MKKIILIFLILISIVSVSFAHSGRTDKYGGHYDSSTGSYHYHNEGYAASIKEDTEEQTENSLIVTDTSEEYRKDLEKKNGELEDQISELKEMQDEMQNELEDRNVKSVKELGDKIDKQENSLDNRAFIVFLETVILVFMAWKMIKYEKDLEDYKSLEKVIRKELNTNSLQDTLNKTKEFYSEYYNSENKDKK